MLIPSDMSSIRGPAAPARIAAAWLLLTVSFVVAGGCRADPTLNIVLVTFDTTRADHIGCYGKATASTPHIDALAHEGVRFDRTYSSVPITLPSHTTILTGTYPMAHGVRDNGLFVLSDDKITLAEILRGEGYRTAAAIGSYPLQAKFGLDQGFDLFDDEIAQQYQDFRGRKLLPKARLFFDERPAARVNEAVVPWLEANHRGPFFLWVHYFDPHRPFEPPPPYDQLFLGDLYSGEIAYSDECFGQLVAQLKRLGVWDRTVVVFTADHGEGIGEHNELTHSILAYNSTLRVPLIIRMPNGLRGTVVEERVGTVDIAPTLLELAGVPVPEHIQGRSLVPELAGAVRPPAPLYAETLSPRLSHGWGELRAFFDGDYKLVYGPRTELFNLKMDPDELNDLMNVEPEVAKRLEGKLARFIKSHAASEVQQVDPVDQETREHLAALGYVQGSAGDGATIHEEMRQDGAVPQVRVLDINLLSMAKQLSFQNKPLHAKAVVNTLLERNPDDPTSLEMLAAANLELGLVDEALATVNKIRGLYPDGTAVSARLMLQLGMVYHYRGDNETALEMLTGSQAKEPSALGHFLIGTVVSAMGNDREYVGWLESALALDPAYAPARMALAIYFDRHGDPERAEEEFRRCIDDQPYFPRPYYNFGAFLVAQGRVAEAPVYFTRAVELDPSFAIARYALVATSVATGRMEDAKQHYLTMRKLVPDSDETEMARRLLEEG